MTPVSSQRPSLLEALGPSCQARGPACLSAGSVCLALLLAIRSEDIKLPIVVIVASPLWSSVVVIVASPLGHKTVVEPASACLPVVEF